MPVPAGGYSESATLPTWGPTREQVADYVPHRTLARDVSSTVGSQDGYRFTWDDTTTPPGTAVDRLIADGCAWVTSRVVPLNTASWPGARVVATLYAAAAVERGWPDDDDSLQRANDLEKRMDSLLADLVDANNASNGTGDYGIAIAPPYWSFPAADYRYDNANYW